MKIWKYIPAVVALIVILGINEITVQAEENNEEINVETTSDVFIDGTEYSLIERTSNLPAGFSGGTPLTEDDILYLRRYAPNEDEDIIKIIPDTPRITWLSLSNMNNFVYYGQLKSYTCGPACVRMALKYVTGNYYSEATVESGCLTTPTNGTTLPNLVTYLNSQISGNYLAVTSFNQTNLENNLYTGVVTYDRPPIVGVQETQSDGWPYNLPAHFVVVYGIRSDKAVAKIRDPWAGYQNQASAYGSYMMTSTKLYNACTACNLGYVY